MATFKGTFFTVQNTSVRGAEHAAPSGKGCLGCADLFTSGTAQTVQRAGGDFVAPADGYFAGGADGDVRMAAGETAAAGASGVGVLVRADQTGVISVRAGQSISVIDA